MLQSCLSICVPTTILITVQDFIFYISYRSIASKIGWTNMFWYTMQRHDPRYLHTFLMNFLHEIEPKTNLANIPIGDYAGEKVPPIICEWFLGQQPSLCFLTDVKDHISKHTTLDSVQQDILATLAQVTFDPRQSTEILEDLPEGMHIVNSLRETRRYKIIGIINSNDELFELITGKFAAECALFNDIITSQEAQSVMPHKQFFIYVLRKHDTRPDECLYIGNYEPSVKTAQELGIPTLVCNNYNFADVLTKLQATGLLN